MEQDSPTLYSYGGFNNSCKRKNKYTEEIAKVVAKKIRKTVGAKVRPYLCRHCKQWHVGHYRLKSKRLADEYYQQQRAELKKASETAIVELSN